MPSSRFVAVVVAAALFAPLAARADIQKDGPQRWPGKNEISLHLGWQGSLSSYTSSASGIRVYAGSASSGGRFTFDYGRLLSDAGAYSIWLDLGFNFVVGGCNVAFLGANYDCSGAEFRPFGGVKLKFRTPIPLVPYAKLGAGAPIVFNRFCDDNGFGAVVQAAGGVKYFLTRNIGVGVEGGFSLGPVAYRGVSASDAACFSKYGYYYDSHVEFYAAYDFQAGAEFVF